MVTWMVVGLGADLGGRAAVGCGEPDVRSESAGMQGTTPWAVAASSSRFPEEDSS